MSCGNNEPVRHFIATIDVSNGAGVIRYTLTDSSLEVMDVPGVVESRSSEMILHKLITDNDSLLLIANLDPKMHDCKEQHRLNAERFEFKNDSIHVMVDVNINHPKELDYAVRIINSMVPQQYKLEFIDMQEAIEPDGQLRL